MIVCFLLFIFGFAVASFISEDREFSENENRYLQQAPEFSWKKLEKGEFTSDIESYMSDQIFMKDQLVSLKTVTDRTSTSARTAIISKTIRKTDLLSRKI